MVSSILKTLSLLTLGASCLAAPSTVKRSPTFLNGAGVGGLVAVNNLNAVNNLVAVNAINNAFTPVAFNNFGGLASLNGFDNFFGVNNFAGVVNAQLLAQQQLVCQQLDVNLIQQRLAVVREFTKSLLLQQACDTELQVLALNQFLAGFDAFNQDLRRLSGRNLFFDAAIANQIGNIFDANTFAFNNVDLGFLGHNIGANAVFVNGFNWVDATSPVSVGNVFQQSVLNANALLGLSSLNSSNINLKA